MAIPRIFQTIPLQEGSTIKLDRDAANHIKNVLRLRLGSQVTVFNGEGGEYAATIEAVDKRREVSLAIGKFSDRNVESPLKIHLGQVISRGEKMDFTIQKAVELGVTEITPLFSERCNVRLAGERLHKREAHWQKVIVSASEQSGRTRIAQLQSVTQVEQWLQQPFEGLSLCCAPQATDKLSNITTKPSTVRILIGPEGGLSDAEIELAQQHDFQAISLGPRILRTETAALSLISALQSRFGDI